MSTPSQITTHDLWIEGRKMAPLVVEKIDATTLRISWQIPTPRISYNGAIVLLNENKFSSLHFPVDSTRYVASTNWQVPADKINDATVVAAFYGFFGDDINTTSVVVSNVDPDKIYYASIHASSNVLQYFTIGVQSYPLESSRLERGSDSYAGSIPTLTVPPANPTHGEAYFDPTVNKVFTWNDSVQGWIETSDKTSNVGQRPTVQIKQFFYNVTDQALKIFLGGSWINATPLNTRIKFGSTWVPLGNISLGGQFPDSPSPGDVFYITFRAPMSGTVHGAVKVFTMGQWFTLTSDLIQIEVAPSVWENVLVGEETYGFYDPIPPRIGDTFYNTSIKDLFIWDGINWTKATTAHDGSPISDKIGVGTDGSYDERLRLIKVIKGQMGWPQVCVELSEEQFNIAIDNALEEFRRRADNAYMHRFVLFSIKAGQNLYYLNDPRNDTDKIVNVIRIHRISLLGVSALSTEANVYAQAFFHQFFQGSMVDLISLHLTHQLSETFERIFAGNITFTWHEASRELMILRRTRHDEERVVLEVVMERTEQEILLDRWAKQWIQAWAHAELKEMLGMIRSKYGTLPGPNGGITMNGDLLLSEARLDFEELKRQINDFEVGNGGLTFGNTAFLIG